MNDSTLNNHKDKIEKDPYAAQEMFIVDLKNDKIVQKLKLLDINDSFIRDLRALQKKWRNRNEKSKKANSKLDEILNQCFQKELKEKNIKDISDIGNFASPDSYLFKKYGILKRAFFNNLSRSILLNKKFIADVTFVVKKYKLLPFELWFRITSKIITANVDNPSDISPGDTKKERGWDKELARAGFIKTENCEVYLEKNDLTGEVEVIIKPFPDASEKEIRESFKARAKLQKIINTNLGTKQYYPRKNLENFKKLKELDKDDIRIFDEDDRDSDNISAKEYKLSDIEKAEEVYGEGVLKNKKKVQNKLKQMRHQYKKIKNPKNDLGSNLITG